MTSNGNWKVVETGEIFDLINGYAFKGKEFLDTGAPVLKIKNVKAGSLNLTSLAYVDEEFLSTKPDKVVWQDDLLISMSGNRYDGSMETWVGKVCWFGLDTPYLVNQRVGILRLKSSVDANPRFLAYQLSSESFQRHFIAVATSSGGQANLSPAQIKSTELLLPPKNVQDWIVSVAGSLEDKIQLNHQINQTLEQMAQAIFKSWFVDFEPVKAKIAALEAGGSEEDALLAAMQAISGKGEAELTRLQAEQSEQYAELRATAELFPSAMQDSELGEIPEGWNIASIGDLCSVRKGLSYKGTHLTNDPKDAALVNLGNFAGGGAFRSEKLKYYDGEFKLRHLVSPGQLMVANTDMTQNRVILGSPLIVPSFAQDEIIFTHHTFAVDFKQEYPEQRWKHFIYHWCLQPSFRARAEGFATGTTVLALPKDAFLRCDIVLTTGDLVDAFNSFAVDAFTQREKLIAQNETLEHLREALLPKLLSGEISISTAEDQLAEAAEPTNV